LNFIDLFCGVGGFRIAMENACLKGGVAPECVFSSDIDEAAREVYRANFGHTPHGDITKTQAGLIPDHDILLAGFPCQAFSICGEGKGFADARGTLFFEIARILKTKSPRAFVLENVKRLKTHDGGNTLRRIMETLAALGYSVEARALNALDFGLPQKRERVFVVGMKGPFTFTWPEGRAVMTPLADILETNVPRRYYASEAIRSARLRKFRGKAGAGGPAIWHENKSGHVSAHDYSCALRAGASYNYLLVDGQRRLTEREMMRLQGFPDSFKPLGKYTMVKKQAGNSLPVPVAEAILASLIKTRLLGAKPMDRKKKTMGRPPAGSPRQNQI